jgi:hypothetical protein
VHSQIDRNRLLAILDSLDPQFGHFVDAHLPPTHYPLIKIPKDLLLKPLEDEGTITADIGISSMNKDVFRDMINKPRKHPQEQVLSAQLREQLAETEAANKIPVIVTLLRDDLTPYSFFIVPLELYRMTTGKPAQA